jgi:hypothetical protein
MMYPVTDLVVNDMQTCGVTWTGDGAQMWLCNLLAALVDDKVIERSSYVTIMKRTYPGLGLDDV